ncbi:uncharacterized protein L3040_004706 [Drepanopeziza brunnea f. sp. 'multigermtubi']|uniref:uncharacterized protein n=1 Tax=Drepanopeziza brunnea f. sp. 'multigermtubi' TaxID=698441 RepID=UPI00239D8D06|nr:hypothetical protein L3040_004706 [Drepanopeziza brunnea f. sp. 'multigermtubi']
MSLRVSSIHGIYGLIGVELLASCIGIPLRPGASLIETPRHEIFPVSIAAIEHRSPTFHELKVVAASIGRTGWFQTPRVAYADDGNPQSGRRRRKRKFPIDEIRDDGASLKDGSATEESSDDAEDAGAKRGKRECPVPKPGGGRNRHEGLIGDITIVGIGVAADLGLFCFACLPIPSRIYCGMANGPSEDELLEVQLF